MLGCLGCQTGPVRYWGLRTERVGGLTFISVANPYPTLSPDTIRKLVNQLDPERASGSGAVSMLISPEGAPWDVLQTELMGDPIQPGPDDRAHPMISDPSVFPPPLRYRARAAWYLRLRGVQEYVWYDQGEAASIERLSGPTSPRFFGEAGDARLVMIAHGKVGEPLRPEIRWFVKTSKEPTQDEAIRLTSRLVRDFALEGARFKGGVYIRQDSAFGAHYGQGDMVEPFRHLEIDEALRSPFWECSFESPVRDGIYRCVRLLTSEIPGITVQRSP